MVWRLDVLCSGDKFEKNATAIPRQSGYLETARAMYEYAYYKDEELAQAVVLKWIVMSSVVCLLQLVLFLFSRKLSSFVSLVASW